MMPPDLAQGYGDWRAPKHDGGLLVWPDPATLPAVAAENRAKIDRAGDLAFAGTDLRTLRDRARAFVGHDGDAPLFVTGHQSELHHPGVWVKNAVVHAAANAAGGGGLHVAVDTDQPKHLTLRWPGFEMPVSDDPHRRGAAWAGLVEPPTPAHLETLLSAADLPANVAEFLADCRRFLIDQRDSPSPMTLPAVLADAGHKLDWRLGLRHSVVMLSGLLECESWAALVLEVARDAGSFRDDYNAALREHRAANGPRRRTGRCRTWRRASCRSGSTTSPPADAPARRPATCQATSTRRGC